MAMDPNPKSAKFKVAFTGTNSSGKTTMSLDVTARLKAQEHVLAEVVSSQDRKITWKDDHFPVNPVAHYGMICNLIHAEVQACLKGDATIVVTDRSALDLYAVAAYDHPDSQLIKDLGVMVRSWLTTYTRIYYLPPLAYQEDGKRPSDEFRMATHRKLIELIDEWQVPNLVKLDRPEAYRDIKTLLGLPIRKPDLARNKKFQLIANSCRETIVVKKPYSVVTSDEDVFVLVDALHKIETVQAQVKKSLSGYFGRPFDVMVTPYAALEELKASGAELEIFVPEI